MRKEFHALKKTLETVIKQGKTLLSKIYFLPLYIILYFELSLAIIFAFECPQVVGQTSALTSSPIANHQSLM